MLHTCKRCVLHYVCILSHFSHVQLFVTLWTVARQAPLSMGFSRWEYWSGLPCPPPSGDLPDPGIKPKSLMSPTLAGGFFTTSATWEAQVTGQMITKHLDSAGARTSSLPERSSMDIAAQPHLLPPASHLCNFQRHQGAFWGEGSGLLGDSYHEGKRSLPKEADPGSQQDIRGEGGFWSFPVWWLLPRVERFAPRGSLPVGGCLLPACMHWPLLGVVLTGCTSKKVFQGEVSSLRAPTTPQVCPL